MAVPEQTPYIEHTGNGVTTSFALKFQCESKDHLIVLVDDIEPSIATWSLSGGNVVFTTAPAAGKKIILQRNTPFGRTADYQSFNNSFRPQAVNGDFDRLWLKLQELGVADWLMKLYVDRLHQQQEEKIDDLKGYVDDRDDELRAYLMEEIRKQGVALDQLDDYYNYLMQRLAQIAVDKGWDASFVVDASGKTQQQVNDNIAVKILRASEIGLTKWTEFKKPPYTSQEYEQAYANGENLVAAIKKAHEDGYSKVVLERGNYPMCYKRIDNKVNNIVSQTDINGIMSGMEVDLNGSVLFSIFDSNNRSPYDAATTSPPYELSGCVITFNNTRNLTIKNGIFRGDQYMRSWLAGEQNTEQTYGLFVGTNNINFNIEDNVFTGFRGDGLCGKNTGTPITGTDLTNWYIGGLDATGNEIPQENGSYRSRKMDIRTVPTVDESIQLQTLGSLQAANFRNDTLDIYFFNNAGAFISKEAVRQTENILLPKDCKYVQIVTYEDERTDATVTYGQYLFLATGSTLNGAVSRCKFYGNHRGGIANLCRTLLVDDCDFHDNGTTKLGFPSYWSTTRYCINFEDTYNELLVIRDTRMKNSGSGILCNARNLQVSGGYIKDMLYAAFGLSATSTTTINNVLVDNVAELVGYTPLTVTQKRERTAKISGCTIRNSNCPMNISGEDGHFLDVSDSFFFRCWIGFVGNGKNLNFNGNTVKGFRRGTTTSPNAFVIAGALSSSGNNVITTDYLPSTSGQFFINNDAKGSSGNQILLGLSSARLTRPSESYPVISVSGLTIESTGKSIQTFNTTRSPSWDASHVDKYTFKDVTLINTNIQLGELTDRGYLSDNVTVFDNLELKKGAYLGISRNESASASKSNMQLIIKNSKIDLTDSTYLIRLQNLYSGSISIVFLNCTFISDVQKSMNFINGTVPANLTATALGCTFANVVNTSTALQMQGTTKVTYDPPSLENGVQQSTTVALTEAKVGDNVNVSFDKPLSGTRMWGEVTSANTVTVYHRNDTGATVDVASGTLTVKLI